MIFQKEKIKEFISKIKNTILSKKQKFLFLGLIDPLKLKLNEEEDHDSPFSNLLKKSISYNQLISIISGTNREASILLLNFLYKYSKIINEIADEKQELIKINDIFFDNDDGIIIKTFYLELLVNSDEMMIWYVHDFTLIESLMKILHKFNEENLIYKTNILARLIYNIIKAHENSETFINENQSSIDNYNNNLIDYLSDTIVEIKKELKFEYDIDKLLETNIQKIYCSFFDEIFILMLNNDKKTENILIQMELEDMNFTRILSENILDKLNNEESLNKIELNEVEDIINETKINFLFFVIKYFIKDASYYTHIKFLENQRKNLIKILKNKEKLQQYIILLDNNKIDKIKFIIKKLLNNSYVIKFEKIFLFAKIEELKIIENYYKYLRFTSKKHEIVELEKIIFDPNNLSLQDKKYEKNFEDYKTEKKYEYLSNLEQDFKVEMINSLLENIITKVSILKNNFQSELIGESYNVKIILSEITNEEKMVNNEIINKTYNNKKNNENIENNEDVKKKENSENKNNDKNKESIENKKNKEKRKNYIKIEIKNIDKKMKCRKSYNNENSFSYKSEERNGNFTDLYSINDY